MCVVAWRATQRGGHVRAGPEPPSSNADKPPQKARFSFLSAGANNTMGALYLHFEDAEPAYTLK